MSRSRRKMGLSLESLESRSMMASDFQIAIYLETLDMNDSPVSKVEVGETFKLRMSAEDLNAAAFPLERGVGGYVGLTFDAKLADKVGDLNFSSSYSINRNFKQEEPGRWEDVGAQPNLFAPDFATPPRRRVQWEVSMVAKQGGEVVFQTNPSDSYGIGIHSVYYSPSIIQFGNAHLQIGDPVQYPASPWRYPNDPSDVDGNGVVDEEDLQMIETILGFRQPTKPYQSPVTVEGVDRGAGQDSSGGLSDELLALIDPDGKIVLDGSNIPKKAMPYLDVNGDRIADASDVKEVKERFLKIPESGPPLFSYLLDPNFRLEMNAVNLRTGEEVLSDSEVKVGDLVEVRLVGKGKELPFLASEVSPESHFKVVDGRPNLLQMKKEGTFELKIEHNIENVGRRALVMGVETQVLLTRLRELFDPLSRTISVRGNAERPIATDLSYSYPQLVGIKTARQLNELLSKPDAMKLAISADRGLLKNVSSEDQVRAVVLVEPNRGTVRVNQDGSLVYQVDELPYNNSLYDSIAEGDTFTYVLVSPNGISDIRTVKIEGAGLPLLDLSMRATDASGEPISSIAVGKEFYLEVSAFGNDIYRRVPPQFPTGHSLFFDYQMDSSVGQTVEAPETPSIFDWERYSLGQEDGKLVLVTEMMKPGFRVVGNETKASFDRYSLRIPEITLFRQKLVGTAPGELKLSLNDARLDLEGLKAGSVNVIVSSIEIVAAPKLNSDLFDVSGNGKVSPLDALMIINQLNLRAERSSMVLAITSTEIDACDVNRDGEVGPLDALLVINWLNANHVSASDAEGEAAVVSTSNSAISPALDAIVAELDSDLRSRRPQFNPNPTRQRGN